MTPAQAMLWQACWRHRWGLLGDAAYLVVAAATIRLLPSWLLQFKLHDDSPPQVAFFLATLCIFLALHVLVMFSAVSANERGKESEYPTHFFVLPVQTPFLVFWPMLYGCVALAGLWLLIITQILWPGGLSAPLWWPMALAWFCLTGMQALAWTPISPTWLRACGGVPIYMALIGGILLMAIFGISEILVFSALCSLTIVSYAIALHGVAMSRRGDVYDWRTWQRLMDRIAKWRKPSLYPFSSPLRAQLWFDCRALAWMMPAFIGLLVPLLTLILAGVEPRRVELGWRFMAILAALPMLMSGIMGAAVARQDAWSKYDLGPFLAARPLTTTALVKSKMQMCAVSAFATWLICFVGISLVVLLRPGLARSLVEAGTAIGAARGIAILLIAVGGSLALTWLQMATALWLGFTGREWVVNAFTFGFLALLGAMGLLGFWIYLHPELQPRALAVVPWVMGTFLAIKFFIAACVLAALLRSRLATWQSAAGYIVLWCLVVCTLTGLAAWLVPPSAFSLKQTLIAIVLFIPFSRLAGAPLALNWNRHR